MNSILSFFKNRNNLWVTIIVVTTILVYLPSLKYSFYPNLDDGKLVLENKTVTDFPENAKSIFSEFVFGLYHPATTISFIIDYKLFGSNPTGFRIHNLLLHLLSTLLVFLIIWRISKKTFISLFATTVFALHPLHLESVLWISERKDVLYSFYFLLALLSYLLFKEQHKNKFLFFTFIFFFLSLLSKATAVILPVILILFDYISEEKFTRKQVTSKWYFFIFSILFGIIHIKAQNSIDFIHPIAHKYSNLQLFSIPVYSFTWYITHFFAPINQAIKHLYPRVIDGQIAATYYLGWIWLTGLGLLTFKFRKNTLFMVGILFYTISIGLMLKIIPTGNDIVSERYSYIPYIGLALAFSSLIQPVFDKIKNINLSYLAIGLIAISLAIASSKQSKHWKNENTIWSRVIEIEPELPLGYFERGNAFYDAKNYSDAITDYEKAIVLSPGFYEAYIKLGLSSYFNRNNNKASKSFSNAITLEPNNPEAYYHRGNLFLKMRKLQNSITDFNKCIELNYQNPEVYLYKASIEKQMGNFTNAITTLKTYLTINPSHLKAINDLAQCYYYANDFNNALIQYKSLLQKNPDNIETAYYLANTLARLKNYDEAILYYNKVIQEQPKYAGAYINRGNAYLYLEDLDKACPDWQTAYDLGAGQIKQMIEKYCK